MKWLLAMQDERIFCVQVSMQSIIMDIGPSEPSSPASMSVDCVPAHPGLHPAAALLSGSCVSSTELPASAPQVPSPASTWLSISTYSMSTIMGPVTLKASFTLLDKLKMLAVILCKHDQSAGVHQRQ